LARRILLADDSVTAQNMGRRILTDAGYEVVTVNNGSAALKKIQEQKPDLIVLDVYMPGYGGLEVCQRVKETTRIPVLLTVGKLEPFKPDEARRVRADGFIVKPFEASELLSALTKLEDKIVPQPQPQKPGRFAKTLAALEQVNKPDNGEKFGDKETGWKNRLIIPSGGPKAEGSEATESSEPAMHTAPSRPEVVEPKPVEETRASEPAKEKEFERPIPAGIPADITADEIAAISAAAAHVSTPSDPPGASSPEAPMGGAETVETAQAVPESKVPELPSRVAEGTVAEQAVASVLAQAASEVAQAKADEAAQPEKDADVMAAIASLAPPLETGNATQAEPVPQAAEPSVTAGFTGPRWIASSVGLSVEETSLDLHAEMTAASQTATEAAESTAPADAVATVAVAEAVAVESAVADEPATVSGMSAAPAMETQSREEAFAAAAGAGTQDVPAMSSAAPATPAPAEAPSEAPPKAAELAAAWQNWKQIRDSIVGSNFTEQIAQVAAAEIKADSEAAPADPTEASQEDVSEESSEPSAIASIVDSVLAELKPKLVEEIARKMNAEKKSSKKK
jgi:CheY-like chemotaxis protein